MRKVLAKALNKNRRLILLSISNEEMETLNSLLKRVSREHGISLSTLKLNARILRDLGLVSCNGFVKTTESGELVKRLLT
ncbi:MAG: hypothetical protein HYW26_03460 [Candidatus Aenigmarchaeota archaeon]|nr:hypothetical protein [Candidatus Aenigmarchaeota archaeon]